MGNLKEIVGIKNDQDFQTLVDTGSITYTDKDGNEEVIEFSEDNIYFTPDTETCSGVTAEYVDNKIAELVNSAPETLDTLGELAQAIKDNDSVVEALNSAIGNKANQSDLDTTNTNVAQNASNIGALSNNKADINANNITDAEWITKLLTGQVNYGDKIVDKKLSTIVSSVESSTWNYKNYIKFASGLIIQWGVHYPQIDNGDYQSGSISFGLPFTNTNGYSYAIFLQGRRTSESGYRDTTFIPRNATNTKCDYMWYGQSLNQDRWKVEWLAIGYQEAIMQLNDVVNLNKYQEAWEFAEANNFTIKEIQADSNGNRQFKIAEKPQPTEEEVLAHLRNRRELECFSIINRGRLWYNNLTSEQHDELAEWYRAWLDVTDTRVVPDKPNWIN